MRIRINWGGGIAIAIVLFVSFIMYFVVKMSVDKQYDHDMVTDNYYKKEAEFQEKLSRQSATNAAHMQVKIESITPGVRLDFPESVKTDVKGVVSFYRPSDKQLDFELPLEVKDGSMLIPAEKLVEGRWNVEVSYTYKGSEYLTQTKLMR